VNGFTGFLQTVNTINYNRFIDSRALEITATTTKNFAACCLHQPFPSNGFISLTVTTANTKSSLHSLIPFLSPLLNHDAQKRSKMSIFMK
jgi:hypothetical protein